MEIKENPNYKRALEFIGNTDLHSLPNGTHVIDGKNLWVNIVDSQLRDKSEAKYEVHDSYIDIQIPLSGSETFGVMPRSMCTKPIGVMDEVKDILFFDDPLGPLMTVEPDKMIVFGPETAHAPLIGEGVIHKAIFKVKVV